MKLRLSMLAALILVLLVGCAPATPEPTNTPEPTEEPEPTEAPDPTATPEPDPTIVDVATQAGDFETLLLAAEAAGLAATLTEEGPFTIFAPTDEAFQATLEDRALTVGDLTADLALLNEVLLYHVVEGTVSAEDLTGMETVTTLQGEEITVEVDDGEVILNGSVIVVDTDIEASNGIIHVVDGVLVPPTADTVLRPNIPQLAQNVEGFSTLVAAVEAAGLLETLGGTGPFTVFAPTDDAFADALGTLGLTAEDLLGDTELLEQILLYHVVDGAVTASDLIEDGATLVPPAQGDLLQTNLVTGDVVLNGAITVEAADLLASNGIVHVIDGVLLPPGFDYETDAEANLVDVASEAGTFETLLAAAEAAGLVDVLTGDTTFTVFAATDTAFNTTLGSLGLTVDDLTANPDLLAEILSYHLLIGAVDSEAVAAAERFITVDGEPLAVEDIPLTDQLDIEASNGIIHVIDGVLVPPSVSATGTLTAPFSTAALSSYDTGGELFEGAAEIAAYDAATQTIFLLRGDLGSIERLDISDPTNPTSLGIIELGGGPNSVAASGGVIAVAVEGEEVDSPGFVVFLDGEGNELNRLTVGVLPDMVAISPDGNLVVTANEGEPSDDYSIDPEGYVSVIDISGGVADLTEDSGVQVTFEAYNDAIPENVRGFGPEATLA
ncbi:MAG: fasciclin domain-containing protein, partial [Anaerolineae bacterium]